MQMQMLYIETDIYFRINTTGKMSSKISSFPKISFEVRCKGVAMIDFGYNFVIECQYK